MTEEQIKIIKDAYNSNKEEIKTLRKKYEREYLDYEMGFNHALEFVMDTLGIKYKPLHEE